ncbi:MAG: HAD hydrolase-like protein [Candidatus Azotimanducaceae bacterium]|uniref:GMP/IMP nucleotidase n=1 Tax=OM182 bacterium TaxID=2510334 RepID=A0A520S5M5_9GAMM|nr:MAG: hypothetical protein EVA68_00720 [OM182 bacterium]
MQTPNLSNISYLLLDMDGTLLDLHYDNYFWNYYLHQRYSEINLVPLKKAKTYIDNELAKEYGTLNWYCTDHWSKKFSIDIISLKKELSHLIRYRDGSLKFLRGLAKTSINAIVVTNAHPNVVKLKNTLTRLNHWVPDFISSHAYGLPKERREFWAMVIANRNLDVSRTLVIDDNISCLKAAKESGITYQLSITKPDSSRGIQATGEFSAIEDLSTLSSEVSYW